ncbi:helix-turn-helix transcriptional regulator [Rhodoplanes sp. TEM]|uniref:Helix-turn-helix transcriptional regulator n=1 Tax=Rhodoplanes tepidamans TaxID=200616 RepID=A0ABT5JGC7_RHOTP|nr:MULTISPECIES: helix-turn-helix transcriptional regulator [Rhodoplanes]MDC7788672.1 helix-turn-helix transcriptional regulator [Rhodoplanes tepidamans]MDC7984406.1 helix-turn-helix transcriptional regulator [Rhodoplanes sp. TEM]MDQ0358324.1 DNA-binding XRE family transcriptional regulator [Rhodoplanes tepidamans]
MKVRFETTPKGEVAILPRAEYERLVALAAEAAEDAGTARLVAKAREEISAGAPVFPVAVAEALADGENPIRVLRGFREMTQVELAAALGITQGYLSDLESGKRAGPLALHRKLARVLAVPLDLLAPVETDITPPGTPSRRTPAQRATGRKTTRR